MLRMCFLVIAMCCSFYAFSEQKVDYDTLHGQWMLVQVGKEDVTDEDEIWEFSGKNLSLILKGSPQQTSDYHLLGDVVFVGSMKFTVHEISDSEMTIEDEGIVYLLHRLNK